jgi:hypothetical protein
MGDIDNQSRNRPRNEIHQFLRLWGQTEVRLDGALVPVASVCVPTVRVHWKRRLKTTKPAPTASIIARVENARRRPADRKTLGP